MTLESISAQAPELVFGTFRLLPQQRLLYRANTPVRLGCRAREILVALVERAGEIVKKNELVARVWPNTIVEDGTLRVHIAGLRKALNDGKDGERFVENVTGIGYRFVAPIVLPPELWPSADGTPCGVEKCSVEKLLELQRLREENRRLRRVVADLTLDKRILEEKIEVIPSNRTNVAPAGLVRRRFAEVTAP
jgi:DNA-binding winged helix-turn-helix (wHTH) protein